VRTSPPPSNQDTCWDFFIAHPARDVALARELFDAFNQRFKVFLDAVHVLPGTDFDKTTSEAQLASRVTVVCISSSFADTYYAREEVATAITLSRRNPNAHRVVPVYFGAGPEELLAVPYGLRLRSALVVSRDGGVAGVARRLEALLEPIADDPTSAGVMPERPRQTPNDPHPLDRFPTGPMVEDHRVSRSIINAYAELLRGADAEQAVNDANAFRLSASTPGDGTTLIRRSFVSDPSAGTFTFWYDVFLEARLNGPRMLAALLLTVPADRFAPRAIHEREVLLASLAHDN
jgi:hypothetical protein